MGSTILNNGWHNLGIVLKIKKKKIKKALFSCLQSDVNPITQQFFNTDDVEIPWKKEEVFAWVKCVCVFERSLLVSALHRFSTANTTSCFLHTLVLPCSLYRVCVHAMRSRALELHLQTFKSQYIALLCILYQGY